MAVEGHTDNGDSKHSRSAAATTAATTPAAPEPKGTSKPAATPAGDGAEEKRGRLQAQLSTEAATPGSTGGLSRTASTSSVGTAHIMMMMTQDRGGRRKGNPNTAMVTTTTGSSSSSSKNKSRRNSVFAEPAGQPLSNEARIRARARNIRELRKQQNMERRVSFREDEDPASFFNVPVLQCLRDTITANDRRKMRERTAKETAYTHDLISTFRHDWRTVWDQKHRAVFDKSNKRAEEVLAELSGASSPPDKDDTNDMEREIAQLDAQLDEIKETYREKQCQVRACAYT